MARRRAGLEKRTNALILVVTEGKMESAFLRYLNTLFSTSELGVSIQIRPASGGSPEAIIKHAVKLIRKDYINAFVILDTDVTWPGDLEVKARKVGLTLVGFSQCFEAFLLSILEPEKSFANVSSKSCKSQLKKFIDPGHMTTVEGYASVFSKDDVLEARKHSATLSTILDLMFHGKV